jgi:hypothetical protein
MFNFRTLCPVCFTDVTSWASRCPKCHYHPDSYNRAQDDVALIARYHAPSWDGAWRRYLPTWLGGATAGPDAATAPVETRSS